jgi:hypothetical protein
MHVRLNSDKNVRNFPVFIALKLIKGVLCGFVRGLVKSQIDFSGKGSSAEGSV